MKLSKSSLMYHVATQYGRVDDYYSSMDFCEFFWGLVRGSFLILGITFLGTLFGWIMIVLPLISLAIGVNFGWHLVTIEDELLIAFILWLVVLVGGFTIYFAKGGMKDDFENSFVYNVYAKFKYKYCSFIDITP